VIVELEDVVAGVYNVIPSTFKPATEAPFFLAVSSHVQLKLSRLQ
jgi:calpain-7